MERIRMQLSTNYILERQNKPWKIREQVEGRLNVLIIENRLQISPLYVMITDEVSVATWSRDTPNGITILITLDAEEIVVDHKFVSISNRNNIGDVLVLAIERATSRYSSS